MVFNKSNALENYGSAAGSVMGIFYSTRFKMKPGCRNQLLYAPKAINHAFLSFLSLKKEPETPIFVVLEPFRLKK
jgi:hypothetical protein